MEISFSIYKKNVGDIPYEIYNGIKLCMSISTNILTKFRIKYIRRAFKKWNLIIQEETQLSANSNVNSNSNLETIKYSLIQNQSTILKDIEKELNQKASQVQINKKKEILQVFISVFTKLCFKAKMRYFKQFKYNVKKL